MKHQDAVIEFALAHGWVDDALVDLQMVLAAGLDEALVVLSGRISKHLNRCISILGTQLPAGPTYRGPKTLPCRLRFTPYPTSPDSAM